MAVNKYVLYCDTEQNFFTTWSQTRPIHCPNGIEHVIVDSTIGVVETLTPASVSITGIDTLSSIGYYNVNGYNSSISSNAITNIDLSFPSSIFLYGMIFDIPNLRITTEFATTNSFSANTTLVVNLYIAKKFIISSANQYKIGYSRLSGRILPANTVIRIVYYNNSGIAKTFSYAIEINY